MISVGNLAMGGRGKTPVTILLARLFAAAGERVAVLSRGHGRRRRPEGVVVVSDGLAVRAGLDESGDEPMLIARSVPDAAVLVSTRRALAAAMARHVFGASALVLDDGFQHREVARDLDLVLVTARDLAGRRLPFGRLREGVSALRRAHAVIVDGPLPPGGRPAMRERMGERPIFTLRRVLGAPVPLEPDAGWPAGGPVVVLAAIAEPRRFADALAAAGWPVARVVTYRDHHPYRPRDLERVAGIARASGAAGVVTTEKDAVRLMPLCPLPIPVAAVPLVVDVEPADEFRRWLFDRLREARA